MSADPHCIFCKIVAGQIPAKKAYEDDDDPGLPRHQPLGAGAPAADHSEAAHHLHAGHHPRSTKALLGRMMWLKSTELMRPLPV